VDPVTLTCDQATTFAATNLTYTNTGLGGCLIEGQVLGVITGTFDECGGTLTLTQTWTFTDDCGRTSTQQQIITVLPAPQAQFVAVDPIEITCDAATTFAASQLQYSNAGLGGCLIEGQVLGVITGTFDECGGTLTQTWTFTDDCGRISTQTQTITVTPAPQAQFAAVDPITLTCDQATTFAATNLTYTNTGLGGCLIEGQVLGVITGTFDECGGTLTQTWTYTDDCGRISTQTQIITVLPAPQAQFVAVDPIEITCDAATTFAASQLQYSNTGLGGCLIEGQVLGVITGTFDECGGTLTQTWTFTDDCDRTITQTQTITVQPAPVAVWINPPGNITISCDDATAFAASSLSYSNAGLGGCLIEGSVTGEITGSYDECGDILTQTWTFTDACGRTISHFQIITLLDSTPPAWDQTMPEITTVECNNVPEIPTGITATDNCDPNITVIFSETREDGDCEFNYLLIRTWTATDNCGNETVHTQVITVRDTTPPTLICPENIMVNADEGEDFATILIPVPIASDNCGTFTLVNDFTETENASGQYPLGVTTVTYTATDECGNVATCQFTVTVQDEEAPVITCPETITVSCIFEVPEPYASYAEFEAAGGFATDNNEIDEDSFILLSETSDNLSCPETITRTYQISDFDGNTATCEQIIIVIDLIDPTWDQVMPANITVECDAVPDSPAVLTASDNCDTDVPVVFTEVRTDGTCPDSYTLTRTWTATDNCENETIHVQVITVEDTTAPVFVEELPQDQTVECDEVPAAVTLTATDNCGTAIVSIEEVRTDGDCPFSYFLTRTWTATDECGNETTHVQVITVEDTTAPVWDQVMPADITVECDGVPAAPAVVTASDNCDADVLVEFTEVRTDGSCLDSYTLTRTWTATDNCGNETIHVQVITVEDTTPPTWDQVMPVDITVECNEVPTPYLLLLPW
jgi:ribosomal protein S26